MLTVQDKWTADDELTESSKHVENEWRLPLKIKDSPQVSSCWLFFETTEIGNWCGVFEHIVINHTIYGGVTDCVPDFNSCT